MSTNIKVVYRLLGLLVLGLSQMLGSAGDDNSNNPVVVADSNQAPAQVEVNATTPTEGQDLQDYLNQNKGSANQFLGCIELISQDWFISSTSSEANQAEQNKFYLTQKNGPVEYEIESKNETFKHWRDQSYEIESVKIEKNQIRVTALRLRPKAQRVNGDYNDKDILTESTKSLSIIQKRPTENITNEASDKTNNPAAAAVSNQATVQVKATSPTEGQSLEEYLNQYCKTFQDVYFYVNFLANNSDWSIVPELSLKWEISSLFDSANSPVLQTIYCKKDLAAIKSVVEKTNAFIDTAHNTFPCTITTFKTYHLKKLTSDKLPKTHRYQFVLSSVKTLQDLSNSNNVAVKDFIFKKVTIDNAHATYQPGQQPEPCLVVEYGIGSNQIDTSGFVRLELKKLPAKDSSPAKLPEPVSAQPSSPKPKEGQTLVEYLNQGQTKNGFLERINWLIDSKQVVIGKMIDALKSDAKIKESLKDKAQYSISPILLSPNEELKSLDQLNQLFKLGDNADKNAAKGLLKRKKVDGTEELVAPVLLLFKQVDKSGAAAADSPEVTSDSGTQQVETNEAQSPAVPLESEVGEYINLSLRSTSLTESYQLDTTSTLQRILYDAGRNFKDGLSLSKYLYSLKVGNSTIVIPYTPVKPVKALNTYGMFERNKLYANQNLISRSLDKTVPYYAIVLLSKEELEAFVQKWHIVGRPNQKLAFNLDVFNPFSTYDTKFYYPRLDGKQIDRIARDISQATDLPDALLHITPRTGMYLTRHLTRQYDSAKLDRYILALDHPDSTWTGFLEALGQPNLVSIKVAEYGEEVFNKDKTERLELTCIHKTSENSSDIHQSYTVLKKAVTNPGTAQP